MVNLNCPFFYLYACILWHCSFIFIKNFARIYYPIGQIVIPCCAIESGPSNVRHALGDGDGGEAAAILESRVSNARHTLGDGDGGEAAAIIES